MATHAITPDYADQIVARDLAANFHGNHVVYVHWEEHLSFCAALAFPLPPGMPFAALVSEVIAPHYAAHPEAAKIDWTKVLWEIDGAKVTPDLAKSLAENGIGHKSLVRFWTPGLAGFKGAAC